MRKKHFLILASILTLVAAALACNFGASTANIEKAFTARDEAGTQPTTVFSPEEVFHAVVELANAPDDTVVKAVWYVVEAEGINVNSVIDQAEITQGSGTLYFSLSPDQPWPAGTYKVEIYLNDELDRTLDFQVEAPQPSQPAAVIEDIFMARDQAGTQPTTTFAPEEVFYAVGQLANAPDDTSVKAAWYVVEAEGFESNSLIDEAEGTQGSGPINFSLTPSQPWPVGTYKVEIYLNGALDRTLEFQVQATQPSQPAASQPAALIEQAYMARDYEGTQPTEVFTPDEVFYCIVTLVNAPDDTVTKTVWYAVEAEGIEPNSYIDEAELTQGSETLHFSLTPNQPWPLGTYKVEIYLNGVLDRTLEFQVQ